MKLEPSNTQVAEELREVIQKNLSDDDKRVLEEEKKATGPSSNTLSDTKSEFKRINIVEEDDEDDEEKVSESEENKKLPTITSASSTVPAHDIKPVSDIKPEIKEQPKHSSPPTNQGAPSQTITPEAKGRDKTVFLKELKKRQDVKQLAVDEIKRSMYENGINIMKKELDYFDEDDVRLVGLSDELKKEYYSLKMSFHANLALCYGQLDMPKKVIEFCEIVLDAFKENEAVVGPGNSDYGILEKTLLRKALALEKCEKFRDARLVYNEVRQRFPQNMQASQGIHRCDDYLGDRHIDFSPLTTNITPVMTNSSPLLDKVPPQSQPPQKPVIEEISEKTTQAAPSTAPSLSLDHFEKQKAEGNDAFKKGDYNKAYEVFTKIVNAITLAHPEIDKNKEDKLCQLLVSVLSNRAFTCSKISKFYQGIEDCVRILKIDPSNAKAYHRRFVCEEEIAAQLRGERKQIKEKGLVLDLLNKEKSYVEDCMKDLEMVMKHAKETDYKLKRQELQGILDTLNSEIEKLAPASNKPKVQVLDSKEDQVSEGKPTMTSESKKPAPVPQKPQRSDANLNIDEITLQALDSIISSSSLPNNASKFEVELKSFKTHYNKLWQYFRKFGDLQFLSKLYDKREMEAAVCAQVIGCLKATLESE
jgi:tetratricopeptide (TPR) repeat protein